MRNKDVEKSVLRHVVFPFVFLAGVYGLSLTASAAPIGGNVVSGELVGGGSSITPSSNLTTTINQASQNLAIDWQSFNVNSNERVQFIQPNSSSIALNRILSNNGSVIQGQIDANGQVILVNPHGVFFSSTASVNVGGLIASTLDIAPTDFMNGNYIFNEVVGVDGVVINSGTINASLGGNVALIGKQVKNDGLISAHLGSVILAAGKQSILTFDSQGLLGITVTKEVLQSELGLDAAVTNNGEIDVEGGRVLLTASTSQDVFSQAVNSTNLDQATSVVVNEDGTYTLGNGADVVNTGSIDVSSQFNDSNTARIVLVGENVTHNGELTANTETGNAGEIEIHSKDKTLLTENSMTSAQATLSGQGGLIKVLGDKVGLFDSSSINATGAHGGGQVLFGGDNEGSNDSIKNSDFIYLSENSTVFADATNEGDGGKIITFAKDTARIYGNLYARGGLNSGNGGFIETSGLRDFDILKTPTVSATNGLGGEWLIDPYNITIVSGGSLVRVIENPTDKFTSSDYNAEINVSLIEAALAGGDSVTIITGGDVSTVDESGDITLTTHLDYNGSEGASLTLQAENDIIINSSREIYDSNIVDNDADQLTLNLHAKGEIKIGSDAKIYTQGGNFTVGDGGTYIPVTFTNNGSIITTGAVRTGGNAAVNTDAGDINITTTTGGISTGILTANAHEVRKNLNGGNGTAGKDGGGITLSTQGLITVDGIINASGGKGDYENNEFRTGQDGGQGGVISITSSINDVQVTANILSNGGDGDGDSNDQADGGNAGTIEINVGKDFVLSSGISSIGGTKDGGSNGADNTITINGNDTANIFTIAASAALTGSIVTFNGKGDIDNFNIGIDILGTDGGINAQLLDGGDGDDVFTFTERRLATRISGGAGSDTIVTDTSNSEATVWNITGDSQGNLKNDTGDVANFSQIENLTGNTKVDTFTFTQFGSWLDGLIDGGDNTPVGDKDTLTITALTTAIDIQLGNGTLIDTELNVDNVETITATASVGHTLKGANINNDWAITGDGIGDVRLAASTIVQEIVEFNGFHNLTGNVLQDKFSYSGNSGQIDGLILGGVNTDPAIQDILDITALTTQRTIQLGSSSGAASNTIIYIDEIEFVKASTDSPHILKAANINNSWLITGDGIGSVKPTGSIDEQTFIAFEGIHNLTGNASLDVFTFNAGGIINGLILGGNNIPSTGKDVLDITALTATIVQLGTSITVDLNVNQIETITANNSFTNTLKGSNTASDWLISGVISGEVKPTSGSNNQNTVSFFNFNNLVGGDQADKFTMNDSGMINNINGGSAGSIAEYNTIIGRTADSTWNITGNNIGDILLTDAQSTQYVAGFENIQNLTGSVGNDTFIYSGDFTLSGLIDGLGHTSGDVVDISNVGTAKTLIVGSLVNFKNIEIFVGNNTNHTLQGDDVSNNWLIGSVSYPGGTDGANDGVLNGSITFVNFSTLKGGSADDDFSFSANGSIANIDGGITDQTDLATYNTLNGKVLNNTWNVTALNEGSLSNTDTALAYVSNFINIQNIIGNTNIDKFVFSALSGLHGLVLGGDNTLTSTLDTLDIIALGATTVQLGNVLTTTDVLNVDQVESISANSSVINRLKDENVATDWFITGINSGSLAPTSAVDEQDSVEFFNFSNIEGGTAADKFTIGTSGVIASIIGGAVDSTNETTKTNTYNTLIAKDINNIWRLTFNDKGSLEDATSNIKYVNNFISIQNISGGILDDEFIFSNNVAMSGAVDGKGHVSGDIVNVAASLTDKIITIGNTGFLNVEGFIGGNTGNILDKNFTLVKTDGNNIWNISALNSGELDTGTEIISFEGFNNLTGSTGDDLFDFANGSSITGVINGGGQSLSIPFSNGVGDIVDMSKITTALDINIALISDTTGLRGIEQIKGNNVTGSKLTGANRTNIWIISATDQGTVTSLNSLGGLVEFIGIPNLTGSFGSDRFTINDGASLSGNIDGVDSTSDNRLTILNSGVTNTWTINQNNGGSVSVGLTNGTFSNIDTLVGGSVDDIFNISNNITVSGNINGAGGTNTLSIATASDNNWTITSADSGNATVGVGGIFSNINNLAGGSGDDSFDFDVSSSLSGTISGGSQSSQDTIDMSALTGALIISLESDITGIERITANNNIGTTLIAGNMPNLWNVTGGNLGDVTSVSSAGGSIDFIGFANLQGNLKKDDFVISDNAGVSGNIDGVFDSSNINSLIINTTSNNSWDIDGVNSGQVTVGIGGTFSNINEITGGSGDDTFLVRLAGSISNKINGGGENNFDTVDLNEKENIDINLATNSFYQNIEKYIGNNDGTLSTRNSTFTGTNTNNVWIITADNDGSFALASSPTNKIFFENFNNITGGNANDSFTYTADGFVNGIISAGTNYAATTDSVDMSSVTSALGVTLESIDDNTKTNLIGFDSITGNNLLLSKITGANENNTWVITSADDGNVTNVNGKTSFINFSNLIGNAKKDTFQFNADSSLSGLIDGGSNSLSAGDTVNMSAINPIDITLGVDVVRIEEVTGNHNGSNLAASINSTLRSGDLLIGETKWVINGNSGSVTYDDGTGVETMSFINFNNIVGGDNNDDSFKVTGDSISGSIDGGTGSGFDFVDYSTNGITITIGDNTTGIKGIEGVIGNGNGSTIKGLTSSAPDYIWTLDGTVDDGVNDGHVVGGGEDVIFIDFGNIVGGNNKDTFDVSGNTRFTGNISGGSGDDEFNVTLSGNELGDVTFIGGIGGSDTLNLLNGNATYAETYTSNENLSGNDVFTFSNGNNIYSVRYESASTEIINNTASADSLTINGTQNDDVITISDTQFKVNASREVNFDLANYNSLIVDGLASANTVSINTDIGHALLNASFNNVSVIGGGKLTADDLSLINSSAGIDSSQRLNTDINKLSISGSEDVYINDDGIGASLELTSISTTGIVDIFLANGDLVSANPLTSNTGFFANAANGNILLTGSNALSGNVNLLAVNNSVTLENTVDTVLGEISASTFNLKILNSSSTVQLNNSILSASSLMIDSLGDVSLTNDNELGDINIVNANSLSIRNINSSNITNVNVANDAELYSNGVRLGYVKANKVTIDSGNSNIVDTNGSDLNIEANNIILLASNGIGTVDDKIETQSNGEISATNINGGDIAISNIGDLILRDVSNLGGDIAIDNIGDLTIDSLETITDFTDAGTGRIDINVTNGSIFGSTKDNYAQQSDVRAHSISLFLDGNNSIGTGQRPLSVEVPETVEVLLSRQTFIYFYGTEPNDFIGENELSNQIFDLINNLAGQQLIEVESLAQIDPAIFTDVRNYSHSDTALMMPADQRYDELEKDKEKSHRIN
ncbi:MAG: filamentous hemagglutinin N-terminal domain-containing protein [Woeseiaceae bacterium]